MGKWRSHLGAVKKELPFFLCGAASGKAAKDAVTLPLVRASSRESLELRVCAFVPLLLGVSEQTLGELPRCHLLVQGCPKQCRSSAHAKSVFNWKTMRIVRQSLGSLILEYFCWEIFFFFPLCPGCSSVCVSPTRCVSQRGPCPLLCPPQRPVRIWRAFRHRAFLQTSRQ